jgi:ribosomal-protein-alanine N-acetyltransferase
VVERRQDRALPDSAGSWTIRGYLHEDFEALYLLDQECYAPGIAYSRRTLRLFLSDPGAECLVAEERLPGATPRVVAFLMADRRGRQGHIVTVDVDAAYRRRSIGSALLAEMEEKLSRAGVREVELETATTNQPAVAFWQKHGYRACGILQRYYGNGQDAFLMTKPLGRSASRDRAAGHPR